MRMKSTQKKRNVLGQNVAFATRHNLYSTDSRWGMALGATQILAFLDTNMLVSSKRNCDVGGLSQCPDPTRIVLRRGGI